MPEITTPRPRSPTPSPIGRGNLPRPVPHLLAAELLESLPFDEVRRLAQQGMPDTMGPLDRLPLEEVRRLAAENLDKLPLYEIRRLTQQTPSTKYAAPNIKREHDGTRASERPRKMVKIKRCIEAIDLTEV